MAKPFFHPQELEGGCASCVQPKFDTAAALAVCRIERCRTPAQCQGQTLLRQLAS